MYRFRPVAFVLLLGLIPAPLSASEPGDAGALFLRFGLGARASGMGEAFVGVAKDASSVYWNPGAMAAVLGTNAVFMHNEYFQSIRLEQAALTHETEYGTLGLAFTGLYMDDMERFENMPSAIPLGTFSAYDVSFAVGFSRYILPNVSVGAVGKIVHENIDDLTATGAAFDAGIYHITRITGVKFAAVVANVGAKLRFNDERFSGTKFPLPAVAKIGASFERAYPSLNGAVLATFDVVIPNDGDAKQHIGFEFGYARRVFLRAGFKGGYDSQGGTFGLGVKYRDFLFDYAVQLISNDLGDSHRFGFSLAI
ncbi:MAG: PorV/PorQ family protein [Candidatus Krumholzibacteriia bacterium]